MNDLIDDSVEGIDYYLSPEGYRIMTEFFLVKRSYCCSNGCKHCPYWPKAIKGNRKLNPAAEARFGKKQAE